MLNFTFSYFVQVNTKINKKYIDMDILGNQLNGRKSRTNGDDKIAFKTKTY